MKIQLESTSKIVILVTSEGETPARVWVGATDSGIPVFAYITRLAVHKDEDTAQFEAELIEQRAPSAEVAVIPLRLIL